MILRFRGEEIGDRELRWTVVLHFIGESELARMVVGRTFEDTFEVVLAWMNYKAVVGQSILWMCKQHFLLVGLVGQRVLRM